MAGRDGLRHSASRTATSTASKHLHIAIIQQHSSSFVHAEMPKSNPLSPTNQRMSTSSTAAATEGRDGGRRREGQGEGEGEGGRRGARWPRSCR